MGNAEKPGLDTPSPTLARIVEMARDERVAYDNIARHLGCACGGGCESTESEDIEAIRLALVAAHERGQRMGQPSTEDAIDTALERCALICREEAAKVAGTSIGNAVSALRAADRIERLHARDIAQPTEHEKTSAEAAGQSAPGIASDPLRRVGEEEPKPAASPEACTSDGKIASGRRQEVVEQLCKMMGRAYDCVDPYAHEPCDCVCTDKGLRSYQNASHALTFMEECISEGIARRGRTANPLPLSAGDEVIARGRIEKLLLSDTNVEVAEVNWADGRWSIVPVSSLAHVAAQHLADAPGTVPIATYNGLQRALEEANEMVCRFHMPYGWPDFQTRWGLRTATEVLATPHPKPTDGGTDK